MAQNVGMADYPGVSRREVLKTMIMNLRVAELQILLQKTGQNKSGKKNVLQEKALMLLHHITDELAALIFELHQRRFSSVKNYAPRENQVNYPHQMYANPQFANLPAVAQPIVQPPIVPQPQNYQQAKAVEVNDVNKLASAENQQEELRALLQKNKKIIMSKLTPSSFYDTLDTIRTPALCGMHAYDRTKVGTAREHVFKFVLNKFEILEQLTLNRYFSNETRNYQSESLIQLRVTRIEEPFDYLPITLEVLLNDKAITLPELTPITKCSGLLRRASVPIDLTYSVFLNPMKCNTLTLKWDLSEQSNQLAFMAFSVNVVKKVTGDELIKRLQTTKERTTDLQSLQLVLDKFTQNADDVMATTIRASMICPIGKMKMKTPCRSTECKHLQCFDGEIFIRLNEKRQKWQCPVCFQPILFAHIEMDELWVKILKQAPDECNEIEFNPDGSWTYVRTEPKKSFTTMINESQSYIMLDSDDDSDGEENGQKRSGYDIECITLSSEED